MFDVEFHTEDGTAVYQTLTEEIEHTWWNFAFGRLEKTPKAEDDAGHETDKHAFRGSTQNMPTHPLRLRR